MLKELILIVQVVDVCLSKQPVLLLTIALKGTSDAKTALVVF